MRCGSCWRGTGAIWSCSVVGLLFEIEALRRLRRRVEKEGKLTNENLTLGSRSLGEPMQWLISKLQSAWKEAPAFDEAGAGEESADREASSGDQALHPEAAKVEGKGRVLAILDEELTRCERRLPGLREQESEEAEARRDAAVLPAPESLQRILRYEAMLERQFYRAMNQLERLQRARRGEVIPPPLTMEVSGG